MTYPSLFLDAYARFSAVDLPGLETSQLGLRNPDPLVAIDGTPVRCGVDQTPAPLACVRAQLDERAALGHHDVLLAFDHGGAPVVVRRPLGTFGAREIVPLFLVYALVGLLVLWSGGAVLRHAKPSAGATTYAAWTAASSLFFFTFYDYHSTTWLSPVFSTATVGTELAFVWLAYAFPLPPRSPRLRGLLVGATAFAAAGAIWIVASPFFGHDPTAARTVVGIGALPALGALLVAMIARWRRADTQTRNELRSAALGIAVVPAIIGIGIVVAATSGVDLIHAFLPLLGVIVPLSIGYALLRRNVLEARTVLGRALFELPAAALIISVAIVLWIEIGLAVAITAAAALWILTSRVLVPRLFPSRASFRPSIEALRDALGERRRAGDVAGALAGLVEKWLHVESARVVFPDGIAEPDRERLAAGTMDTRGHGITSPVLVPVRALGELRAVLIVGRKRDGAPFNLDDIAVLETIAGFGGLALHHAHVLEELDALRRADLDAAGREKEATVALVGAEVAHEVAYSLNYLRFLLRDGTGAALTGEDIEVGRDEIARLDRMIGALRKLTPPAPQIRSTALAQPIRQAQNLVRELLTAKAIAFSSDDAGCVVLADRDQLIQVMANLLRNAVQAAPAGGAVRVSCARDGGTVTLVVADNGAGVPDELRDRLFTPWASGHPGGTGLGLAVAARIVQGWNGTLRYRRVAEGTEFVVELPEAPV